MRQYIIFSGLPASGKTTFRQTLLDINNKFEILSSDDIIDREAKKLSTTYNKIFPSAINMATNEVNKKRTELFRNGYDFILDDHTNLSPKVRSEKLAYIPHNMFKYKTVCFYFECQNENEWRRRLNNRDGKIIPDAALNAMRHRLVVPTKNEGFDEVHIIRS